MTLTKADRQTLGQALMYHDRFGMGIFPKGAGQWAHFRKLVRDGFLEVGGWGMDENGETDGEVLIHYLTPDGKYEARIQDLGPAQWRGFHMIYVGVPYTDDSHFVRADRFNFATRYAAKLIERGECVFSPITHAHPMLEKAEISHGWEYWSVYDTFMLSLCREMHALVLDGFKESVGLNKEIEIATDLRIPVRYFDKDFEEVTVANG